MITSLYAALLGILFIILSIRTVRMRRKLKIPVGDGGNMEMLRAMRTHANFNEYTPLSLILISFVEMRTGSFALVHFLGVLLLVGRTVHAYGIAQDEEIFQFRIIGMACTFATLIICIGTLIIRFVVS